MKKLIVLLLMMMGALAVHADNYTYLTFETTDGAKVSVEASSLSITISGTTLTAGSQKFTLSNLSKRNDGHQGYQRPGTERRH